MRIEQLNRRIYPQGATQGETRRWALSHPDCDDFSAVRFAPLPLGEGRVRVFICHSLCSGMLRDQCDLTPIVTINRRSGLTPPLSRVYPELVEGDISPKCDNENCGCELSS